MSEPNDQVQPLFIRQARAVREEWLNRYLRALSVYEADKPRKARLVEEGVSRREWCEQWIADHEPPIVYTRAVRRGKTIPLLYQSDLDAIWYEAAKRVNLDRDPRV